jgi:hypothetical protein
MSLRARRRCRISFHAIVRRRDFSATYTDDAERRFSRRERTLRVQASCRMGTLWASANASALENTANAYSASCLT